MFPYDPAILAAVQVKPQNIADVFRTMQTIDATCADKDGLKWFNKRLDGDARDRRSASADRLERCHVADPPRRGLFPLLLYGSCWGTGAECG